MVRFMAMAWVFFVAAVGVGVSADDGAAASILHVAVDWSAVPDAVIERCDLWGLEGFLAQRLVEEGYAVVSQDQTPDVVVAVTATETVLEIEAHDANATARRQVMLSDPCDHSLLLELGYGTLATLTTLADLGRQRRDAVGETYSSEVIAVKAAAPQHDAEEVSVGVRVAPFVVVTFQDPLHSWNGVGATVEALLGPWRLGGGFAVSAVHGGTIWGVEPVVTARAARQIVSGRFGVLESGVEIAAVAHVYDPSNNAGVDLLMRLGIAGRWLPTDWLAVEIVPYSRLTRVRHRVGTHTALLTQNWGMELRLGVPIEFSSQETSMAQKHRD